MAEDVTPAAMLFVPRTDLCGVFSAAEGHVADRPHLVHAGGTVGGSKFPLLQVLTTVVSLLYLQRVLNAPVKHLTAGGLHGKVVHAIFGVLQLVGFVPQQLLLLLELGDRLIPDLPLHLFAHSLHMFQEPFPRPAHGVLEQIR